MKATKIIIALLFFISLRAQAVVFIDIDGFNFPTEGRTGVRLVVFNTEEQRFLHVGYYSPPSTSTIRATTSELPYDHPVFRFFYNGDVEFRELENKELSNYMIHTVGTNRTTVGVPAVTPRAGHDITKFLNTISSGSQTQTFQTTYSNVSGSGEKPFSSIVSDRSTNSDERGRLGELATRMTMQSFGYVRISVPNTSNQGFDGVYIASSGTYLFLTESKCRRKKDNSASKYMQKDLDEKTIYARLQGMSSSNETRQTIEKFLDSSPQNVFKFVHRIKSNGRAQCCAELFNLFRYQLLFFESFSSPTSSADMKAGILRVLRGRMGVSPSEMLELTLKAFNLSREEGVGLLSSPKVEKKTETPASSEYPAVSMVTSPPVKRTLVFSPTDLSTPSSVETKSALSSVDIASPEGGATSVTPASFTTPVKAVKPHSQPFGPYSLEKLGKLMKFLNNADKSLSHKGMGCEALGGFYSENSGGHTLGRTPFRKLVGTRQGNVESPERIWEVFTQNFDKLGVNKEAVLKKMNG